jgi:hypothetical protein
VPPRGLRGRQGNNSPRSLGPVLAFAAAGLAAAFVVGRLAERPRDPSDESLPFAVRRTRGGAAVLAGSVLADSAVEHFRGRYHNPSMVAAPVTAAISLAASLAEPGEMRVDPRVDGHALAAAVGAAGLGFHFYNVMKRPGGFSWNNLFYAAPLGAPGALLISGALGLAARVVAQPAGQPRTERDRGRLLGTVAATSLLATSAEAWLLHFRGAFHNPAMLLPVTVPPAAAAMLFAAARRPTRRRTALARKLLWTTAGLGLAGTGFHMFGVSRNMGGWNNARQNILAGPPVPAPIGFSGLALAGLGAVDVLERGRP